MKKAETFAKCTGGQDGYGEDKVQEESLCCWLKLHAQVTALVAQIQKGHSSDGRSRLGSW